MVHSAQPNITSVGTLSNLSVSGNITSGNANLGNLVVANFFSGNGAFLTGIVVSGGTAIVNGNSNVSVIANANVNISTNGNPNIAQFDTNGSLFLYPTTSALNALRITSVGGASGDVSRISSSRARGNLTSPLSVNPSDATMRLLTFGHNGTSYQTSSLATVTARVDASYTANGANIPIGWQILVNDTNGGINNQSKTHNFYANGSTALAGNLSASSLYISNNAGANVADIQVIGDKTIFSGVTIKNGQYRVIEDNVDPFTGFTPLSVGLYSANNSIPSNRFFRGGNTEASPTAVVAGDQINIINYGAYGDSGNTYVNVFDSPKAIVTGNDGAGNVTGNLEFFTFNNGSNIVFTSTNTYASGNLLVTGNFSGGLKKFNETVYAIGSTSGTITPDFNNGSIQSLTLTGSITLNSLTNVVSGSSMTLVLTQGGTGSYTLTSSMLYAGGFKTLSTAVGAKDIISIFYDGSTYYASLTTGYA